MQGNPLSCNCYLAWFAGWLRKRDIVGITGRCHDPSRLKDAIIKDIPHHEFKCNSAFNALLLPLSTCSTYRYIWLSQFVSLYSVVEHYEFKIECKYNIFHEIDSSFAYKLLCPYIKLKINVTYQRDLKFANNACFVPSIRVSSAMKRISRISQSLSPPSSALTKIIFAI
ncbi:hypothetical protein P5V15_005502 [Pogonomyrmex californicus]